MVKRTPRDGGTGYHVDEPRGPFGSAPRVGQQAKPYNSGDNAHGVHQRRTQGPAPGEKSGHSRAAGPYKGYTGR